MLSPPILLLGAVCLVLIGFNAVLQKFRQRNTAKQWGCQSPTRAPSGFYGLSAFSQLAKAFQESRLVEHIAGRYAEYGRTFQQTSLGVSAISTIEPENLKAMLATQFNDFCLGTRRREFGPTLGDGIFTLDGAGWSHSRALLRPQFTRDQVRDTLAVVRSANLIRLLI